MPFRISVLGSEYEVSLRKSDEDKTLNDGTDGYCDSTVRKIAVLIGENDLKEGDEVPPGRMEDVIEYRKAVLRHEIVHAFMQESGLSNQAPYSQNEELIDWIALQIKKMSKCMRDAEDKMEAEYRSMKEKEKDNG